MEIDSKFKINETSVTSHVAIAVEDPRETLKVATNLIESAEKEILVMLSTSRGFHRQEKLGMLDRLEMISKEKDVSIRILTPQDDSIKELSDRMKRKRYKFYIQFIEPTLSKLTILIVDKVHSLLVELKDDSKESSYEAMGVSTYSNSKATVLSYASIFESLWSTLELHENIHELNKKLQRSNLALSMMNGKYQNLYEKSPAMLRTITADGILTDCNEAYARALGYTKDECVGKSLYEHTAQRSIDDLRLNLENWKDTGDVSQKEIWMKRKDGGIFPVLMTGASLYDENGNLIGRTVSLTDMTEIYETRKKLEHDQVRLKEQYEKLEQSHEILTTTQKRYRDLYEKSPSLLRSIATDGILTDCNEAYAKALGYSKGEAIGMSIYDHTAEKSLTEMKRNFEEWKKTYEVTPSEIWLKRKDGTIFPSLLTGTSLFDEHGNLIGRTLALTDLTEMHKARLKIEEREACLREQFEELKQLNKKLEVKDKMQSEFINVAAHELRSPIQSIVGMAEVLRDKKGEISSQANLIDIIIRSGKRLQRVAENILDVTRIESNTLELYREEINLRELLYDLFQDFHYKLQSSYEEKDVKLQFEAKEDIFVTADRARLTQVILNLFNNAIKFTDEGVITISIQKIDDTVLVKVRDTGKGISNSILPKLFTKFVTSKTGTGLGLFISKKIVEAHGGNMWAMNNAEGSGATFTFTIPAN
jgi:PAS domain S-box-containing protein